MASTTLLGKRKRISRTELKVSSRSHSASPASQTESSDQEDVQDIFRRAFEAKFKPLEVEQNKKKAQEARQEESEDQDEESDWSGISSDANEVEVFEYTDARSTREKASRAELRAFMSAKPPTPSTLVAASSTSKTTRDTTDASETAHLKNDVALQRLLRDSHLLSTTSASGTAPTSSLSATGALRHKSLDLHLQSLGAKSSIHAQKNMPMSHRKGITAKTRQKEERRRAEARQNGVILEKEVRVRKGTKERDRGVGAPSVGKFKRGMLVLSKNDVRGITGSGGGRGGKGGKSKRGRR